MSPEHFRKWFPTFCDGAKEGCAEDDFGAMVFNAQNAFTWAEQQFIGAVMLALGAEPGDPNTWPFDWTDTRFDDYDQSFEFKGVVNPDFQFTAEQWESIELLGFDRAWLCYADGSERFYPGGRLKPAAPVSP